MACSICNGPVNGSMRTDPAHAGCVRLADDRKRAGMCYTCGIRPVYHAGLCAICSQ